MDLSIYRKPTYADITIQFTSNHPQDHKLAAFTYYINRMSALPITEQAGVQEWNKILTIAQNNGFPTHTIHNLKKKLISKQKKSPVLKEEQQTKQKEDKKWITFRYHSPLVRKVTNLLKKTNINPLNAELNPICHLLALLGAHHILHVSRIRVNIAFRATNTVYQQLSQKSDNTNPSGIYEIKCKTCNRAYIGQSGRPIAVRHKEHARYIRTNNPASAYAIHILNNRHENGATNDTLKLLQPCSKGMKMNCWESLYIHIYRQHNRLIIEQLANDVNPLYEQAYLSRAIQNTL